MLVSQNGGKTSAVNNENQVDTVQVDNGRVNFHFTQIVPDLFQPKMYCSLSFSGM